MKANQTSDATAKENTDANLQQLLLEKIQQFETKGASGSIEEEKTGKKGLSPELAELLAKNTQIKDDPALETPQRKEKLYAVLQEAIELSKKDEELFNSAQRRVNYSKRKQVLRKCIDLTRKDVEEIERSSQMKQKLETLCRELDKQIKVLDEEVALLRSNEQKVRADMKDRFEKNFQGIKDKIELEGYGESANEDTA